MERFADWKPYHVLKMFGSSVTLEFMECILNMKTVVKKLHDMEMIIKLTQPDTSSKDIFKNT